ncbi:MAG: cupin domain-containing protein [Cyanobium sp. CZS 25K]|nr:cupin domain-containing protein [Cyanobium sp. CZS25K]
MPKPLTPAAPSRFPLALMAAISLSINTLGSVASAVAHPLAVVPETERLPGRSPAAIDAPTSNAGVLAVRSLGSQPLGGDFSALEGRVLRLREITIAPGGHIGLHRHDSRPGVAYLLEGRLTERRGPAYGPVVLEAGEAAFETTGVTHWWRNETSQPAQALVVDIVEESSP